MVSLGSPNILANWPCRPLGLGYKFKCLASGALDSDPVMGCKRSAGEPLANADLVAKVFCLSIFIDKPRIADALLQVQKQKHPVSWAIRQCPCDGAEDFIMSMTTMIIVCGSSALQQLTCTFDEYGKQLSDPPRVKARRHVNVCMSPGPYHGLADAAKHQLYLNSLRRGLRSCCTRIGSLPMRSVVREYEP